VSGPQRVFVRLPNWLGDALMARPLLHAVRAGWPAAHVSMGAPAALVALLASDRVADEALPWPVPGGARIAQSDVALVLPPSFSSAWHAWRSGARRRVGFADDGRSWLLTDPVRRPARGTRHLSEEYLQLGAAAGLAGRPPLPALTVAPAADEEAGTLLREAGVIGRPFAILAPGAAYGPAKRWDAGRFAALAARFADRGLAVLLCGGAGDREACTAVAAAAPDAVPLAGRTSLPVMAALCARATGVVSNDSGLAHLAAATGAATIVLFGSTSSAWTAPLGPRVRVLQHAPVCSPCFQRTCRIGTVCFRAIGVDEVAAACAAWAA
jgi:heptosyltransferase-2